MICTVFVFTPGERKSILLGGVACVLALLGYEVYCASYSQHLSTRDYEAFCPLFELLVISTRIKYSTLTGLAESLVNQNGNVRDLSSELLLEKVLIDSEKSPANSFDR